MLIQRYLLRRLFGPAGGVFLFSVVVVAVFYLAQILGWATGDGWPLSAVLTMAGLRLVLYFDVLIPASLLIGMVVGMGRIQQSHELTALVSAGIAQHQILKIMGWGVALVAIGVACLSTQLRPWGYSEFYTVEASLAARLDVTRVEPGRFQVGDEEWLIYAGGKEGEQLRDVFVHQLRESGRGLLTAKSLRQWVGEDGLVRLAFDGDVTSYRLPKPTQQNTRQVIGQFDSFEIVLEPKQVAGREKIRRALPMSELWGTQRPIEQAELQWRLVTPLSVVLLAWLATLLVSTTPRRHRNVYLLVAILTVSLYFSALGVLVNWVEQGRFLGGLGVFWAPVILFIVTSGLAMARHQRWMNA